MAFTLAAFGEDIDIAGNEQNITAVQDDHLFTSGDDLRCPPLNRLFAVAGGLGSGGTGLMRVESPSIRKVNRLTVAPLNGLADADVEPSDPIAIMDMRAGPRVLDVDEIIGVRLDSNTSAAAFQWTLLWFSDGATAPVSGEMVTVHADSGTTVTARAWSTVPLTFVDALPRGRYQIVGARFFGATAIAGRFIFKPGTWRPGAIALDSQTTQDVGMFRYGNLGVWGEFEDTTPPDAEFLCDVADTSQDVEIDLIKVR